MKTVIKKNTWLLRKHEGLSFEIDFGWGNGYVLIPEGHGLYNCHYDVINRYVDIHGGLTFSQIIDERLMKLFDLKEEDLNKWMVGFDTCHCDDTLLRWPKKKVQEEADILAQQLELLSNETPEDQDNN